MNEHDESLEVGLAAGMDIPSAMVLSERDGPPPRKSGCGFFFYLALAMLGFIFLLKLVKFEITRYENHVQPVPATAEKSE